MTVYCPQCGSANLHPKYDPRKIDEEIDQVLMSQLEECMSCHHIWVDKWWEIWTPDGIKIVSADSKGNAIKDSAD